MDTWRLVDERVSVNQEPGQEMEETQTAGTSHSDVIEVGQETAVRKDRRVFGETAERGPPLPHKVWRTIRVWYRVAVDHAFPPA